MIGRFLCATAIALTLTGTAMAQEAAAPTPIIFPAGSSGIKVDGSVSGDGLTDYILSARRGQTLQITMTTDNASSYFNIYAPGAVPGEDEALFIGSTTGNEASLALPEDGAYLIRTYLMRSAARRDENATYTLDVSVTGDAAADTATADPAGAGPDFVNVTGLEGHLNIRSDPSTTATVTTTVPPGERLRNQGCKQVGDTSWCQVETLAASPVAGWAVGSYLEAAKADAPEPPAEQVSAEAPPPNPATKADRPADAPTTVPNAPTPPRPPAVVSDTKPAPKPAMPEDTAKGALPCSTRLGMPTRDCGFTVTRQGNGNASLKIDWPDGGSREIHFENGAPAERDDQITERRGDLTVINIGNERYEIPDAVILGG
ncbi:SH3 domain-containing protein [Paracoccus aerodenitrificans]|uniref:SH3 domain-containing protein n=1 Tax=Paracoccus aerodenitrificans TaxID=3017781 RepID=UPI0022F069C5|nr:SH3 domain-containing protein [Paracoccus aerodenitrificans]WBU64507.1 SH3 domain-containing protein [Paracoccus aerodenitrificans]